MVKRKTKTTRTAVSATPSTASPKIETLAYGNLPSTETTPIGLLTDYIKTYTNTDNHNNNTPRHTYTPRHT